MFENVNLKTSIKFAVFAALLFCIPTFIYIRDTTYSQSWLLYLGSFLFFIVITLYTMFFNRGKNGNANTVTMIFASHLTTVIGIVLSCIVCFIMLSVMIPGYLEAGPAGKVAPDAPANAEIDKTNGLSFRVFMGASLINFCFGSFVGIMYPFTIRRNLSRDSGEPRPLRNKRADMDRGQRGSADVSS